MTYLRTGSPRPPKGAVVITMDDGHRSVLREALPLVREFKVPVTLFIYPSAISNASYAMTWEDLRLCGKQGSSTCSPTPTGIPTSVPNGDGSRPHSPVRLR